MRIADKMQYGQINSNIQKNRQEMSELQNQASTQKRVNKPSDDPSAAARVLSSRTEERGGQQFLRNIQYAKSFLEFTDNSLSELGDVLVRAKELAVGQASDAGANAMTRQVTAREVEQIYDQAVQVGNRKLGDRYIFGGFSTTTQPFSIDGEYFGDAGDMKVHTQKEAFVAMNVPGSKVFMGKGLGGDGITRAGSFTPKTVEELGVHRENIRQEKILESEAEENYVQTRGPASYGQVGAMGSKDPVTDSPGINLFQVLKGFESALRTNDKAGVQESLEALDQAISQVLLARSEVGSRLMSLNNSFETLQKAIVDDKTTASQLEDADIFQTVSDINRVETALKATLETSPKMVQPTLLDFLR
jgi:flagellar hook-associated protein 3 FlgL